MELFNLGNIPWEETQLIYHSFFIIRVILICRELGLMTGLRFLEFDLLI